MKLQHLVEMVTKEEQRKYDQWVSDCKRADPNCTFAGGIGGGQAVNWIDPGNKVVGDWDGKTMSGVVYSTGSQDNTRMDEQNVEYAVGEQVLTQVGGKWIPGTITAPAHRQTGNYGVKVKVGKTTIKTMSSPSQLKKIDPVDKQ